MGAAGEKQKMPYIKKIEITGFKTFGVRTTLLFDKGFTAITGPNGSGKTNIVDAVLFCLGELSVRRLRAENFPSLIFHGGPTPDIKKKDEAKVVIQLDNSDSRIPVETATVTISREIDHSGESVYRMNGRRVPRSHFLEVLSVAGISPYGHNVVLQGTLTRMAEISPAERRKMIEDMIGIAQYDDEKAESEEKLKSAEMVIKTSQGQVGEIQKRIEDLERERNNLLRHNFIQGEIKRLEAVNLSQKIRETEGRLNQLAADIKKLEEKLEKIRGQREGFRSKRFEIESEWRKLGLEGFEEGQARIFKIQMEIGGLRSKLSELTTRINAGQSSLGSLKKVKESNSQQIESLKKEIEESETRIKQLTGERDALFKEATEKQSAYGSISGEATQLRLKLEEKDKRIRELEKQMDKLYQDVVSQKSAQATNQSKVEMYSQRLKDLEAKRDELKTSFDRLQESLKGLQDIQKEQMTRLETLQKTLEKRSRQRENIEQEISEAGNIAETAKEALVEFEAQKDIVERIRPDESVLKRMEELGELGVIKGIQGRLKNLMKTDKGYERAIEAASAGWLDALVVQDLDTAFTCVETLKRLKLGRIKIVPLQGLTPAKKTAPPKIEGIRGKASAFVKYAEKHSPAISFVLGDTLVVSDEKAALEASHQGFRAVTLSGDLYETGGGVESGFYRAPLDLSSFVPSESALKSLDKAVKTLQGHLERRGTDIEGIEKEIDETRAEITRLAVTLVKLETEIGQVNKSIQQTQLNMKRAEKNVEELQSLLEEGKTQIENYEKKQNKMTEEERKLREDMAVLKKETDLSEIQAKEMQRDASGNEVMALKQKLSSFENELSTLQSKMKNTLKPGLENAAIQTDRATKQIAATEKDVEESTKEKETVNIKIKELEDAKEDLSRSLLGSKEESKKFTAQIDNLDGQLRQIETEYEENDRMLDELKLNHQTLDLQTGRYREQLTALGYEKALEVSLGQVQEAETSLRLMRLEMERIGAVNQLAQSQYADQISRYKELSIRMNDLEKERMAIVKFIEEIEQKKYNAFMEAFNKINQQINKHFSKLTGGGNARLQIENPENPFAGGVDMVVQFLSKPPIIVSGASSGERSVAAVAFLFALQEFTPAAFYLFDEVDAHLDAFHVERLGELLAEEAANAQFVVVTLKPEMVSKADMIYGVYGREGVSHVVSTTFKGAMR
jgi:chromosome segregation protein